MKIKKKEGMKNRTKIDDKGREKKKERQNGLECRPS